MKYFKIYIHSNDYTYTKFRKKRMLLTWDNNKNSYWKLMNSWNQWMQLIWTSSIKVIIEGQTDYILATRKRLKWQEAILSNQTMQQTMNSTVSRQNNLRGTYQDMAQGYMEGAFSKIWTRLWRFASLVC